MLASICGRGREKENVDGTVGEDLPPIGAFECELTSPLVGMKCRFRRRHFLDQVGDTVSRDLVSDKRQQPTMRAILLSISSHLPHVSIPCAIAGGANEATETKKCSLPSFVPAAMDGWDAGLLCEPVTAAVFTCASVGPH